MTSEGQRRTRLYGVKTLVGSFFVILAPLLRGAGLGFPPRLLVEDKSGGSLPYDRIRSSRLVQHGNTLHIMFLVLARSS